MSNIDLDDAGIRATRLIATDLSRHDDLRDRSMWWMIYVEDHGDDMILD